MSGYTVAHEPGIWVNTPDGAMKLEDGATLPEDIHPDEVARLANGGVLAELDQEQGLVGGDAGEGPLPDGKVADLKVRIGTDADLARAYLEREQQRDEPRSTFVAHLEQVIADDDARTEPAPTPAGEDA